MAVRKTKVQNVDVKDGEMMILECSRVSLAGAISSDSDDQTEGLIAPMKDGSLKSSVNLHDTAKVTKTFYPLSVALSLVAKASTVVMNSNAVLNFVEHYKPSYWPKYLGNSQLIVTNVELSEHWTCNMNLKYGVPIGMQDRNGNLVLRGEPNCVVQMLAGQSRQNMVAILDVAMPSPSLAGRQNEPSLPANLHTLTSEVAEDMDDLQAVESMVVHGAIGSGGCTASVSEVKNAIHGAYGSETSRPMFCHLSAARCPLAIPFNRCSAILPFLENRLGNFRKFGIERGCPGTELLRSWGFEKDEVEDIGETLSKMVRIVNPQSEISSDSDSD
ncbi:hypothetical protein V6N11_021862 [Hibiscus sabdariffa]|uniref:Uncharacterized protein n=1 Tax=Hibiscus sabdariffa TaxID=183260 RepID=A0ABR2TI93_9ROSI